MSRTTYRINNRHFEVWRGWYFHTPKPEPEIPYDVQLISLRLADALPSETLEQMNVDALMVQPAERVLFKRQRTEEILDAQYGCCALKNPELARAVLDVLEDQHAKKYKLIAWCILPNQLHVLIEPCFPVGRIIQDWRVLTTRWAVQNNDALGLGLNGKRLWLKRCRDRYIPDNKQLAEAIQALQQSPVKAGLCDQPEDWRWSSAYSGKRNKSP
jgi:putative transposase